MPIPYYYVSKPGQYIINIINLKSKRTPVDVGKEILLAISRFENALQSQPCGPLIRRSQRTITAGTSADM
jgi:hypothetical protein